METKKIQTPATTPPEIQRGFQLAALARLHSRPFPCIVSDKEAGFIHVFGILIKMNWKDNDKHHLPHFHAYYNEFEASFDLNGEIITGSFPAKQTAFVKAWALLHQDELAANWKLAVEDEQVFKIKPLQ